MRARYDREERDDSPLLRIGEGGREQRPRPTGKALALLALNGVAALALLSACVSMHGAVSRLEGQLATSDALSNSKLRSGCVEGCSRDDEQRSHWSVATVVTEWRTTAGGRRWTRAASATTTACRWPCCRPSSRSTS